MSGSVQVEPIENDRLSALVPQLALRTPGPWSRKHGLGPFFSFHCRSSWGAHCGGSGERAFIDPDAVNRVGQVFDEAWAEFAHVTADSSADAVRRAKANGAQVVLTNAVARGTKDAERLKASVFGSSRTADTARGAVGIPTDVAAGTTRRLSISRLPKSPQSVLPPLSQDLGQQSHLARCLGVRSFRPPCGSSSEPHQHRRETYGFS